MNDGNRLPRDQLIDASERSLVKFGFGDRRPEMIIPGRYVTRAGKRSVPIPSSTRKESHTPDWHSMAP